MKKIFVLGFFLFIVLFVFSETNKNSVIPDNIIDISINCGVGVYIGNFGVHLLHDGAYIVTPTLDIYISLFIIKYLGLQALLGSGCVIHPRSEPIEGTIIYTGIELFGEYDWKNIYLKVFAGGGFEHTTMLLQWYSSGFFECGIELGIKITDWMYINNSVKYRMGFLHSIIIRDQYFLDENDILSSMTYSMGLVFRIKNTYKKE